MVDVSRVRYFLGKKLNWYSLPKTFRANICSQIISWVSTSKLKSKCAIILLSKYLCWKVYLRKCKNTYFILQNKYLHIYEDSFGAKIPRDDCTQNLLRYFARLWSKSERVDKIWHFAIECDHRINVPVSNCSATFLNDLFQAVHTYIYIQQEDTQSPSR